MKIINNQCKHAIVAPVTFVNGDWYCPLCGKKIFPDAQTFLKVTDESYSKLCISDRLFYDKWLPHKEYDEDDDQVLQIDDDKKIESLRLALKECKEAAFLNNPYALINLGFYYENGYDIAMSQSMSYKAAALCYNAIADNEKETFEMFGEQKSLEQLKKQAKDNLANLKEKIAKAKKLSGKEDLDEEQIFEIMTDFDRAGDRIPLFGVFKLTLEQALALCAKEKKGHISNTNWNNLLSSVDILIAGGRLEKGVWTVTSEFEKMKNKASMATACSNQVKKGAECIFWGFDILKGASQTRFLSSEQSKALFGNGAKKIDYSDVFPLLVEKGLSNIVFSENDFFVCYSDKKDKQTAFETTLNKIISNC
ncbi:MAG: hypothetical protein RR416_05740 [Clostridia bacterium]